MLGDSRQLLILYTRMLVARFVSTGHTMRVAAKLVATETAVECSSEIYADLYVGHGALRACDFSCDVVGEGEWRVKQKYVVVTRMRS